MKEDYYMEKLKVMGFIASPRKKGNTAWIVNKILEGAKQEGAETQTWYFSDLDIKPCQGCFSCHNGDGGCIINDDMQKIYDAIAHSDVIVFGSPIYMGQMSAQAKIFNDRLFARFSPRYSPNFEEENAAQKKMILVFDQGNPDSSLFQVYFDYMKHIFQLLEFDVKVVPVVTGMRNGPAHERKELHTAMKEIGSSLVLDKTKSPL